MKAPPQFDAIPDLGRRRDPGPGQLRALMARHPKITDVRGRGLMCAVTLAGGVDVEALAGEQFEAGFIGDVNAAARVLHVYPPRVIGREALQALTLCLDPLPG